MYPVSFLAQDRAMRLVKKGCLVFWVGLLLVGPGETRASSGVDCFVSCPPLVAPRRL